MKKKLATRKRKKNERRTTKRDNLQEKKISIKKSYGWRISYGSNGGEWFYLCDGIRLNSSSMTSQFSQIFIFIIIKLVNKLIKDKLLTRNNNVKVKMFLPKTTKLNLN